ncbi:MAG: adenylate/guanylate cyclase domain-containing protein, partial [Chloroflexi bacterium]|nr:adenylate/guanylate cyclase domain-containing protein [Chloroflexota bacterium]
ALTSETTIQSPIPVADADEDASITVMFIDIEDFGAMSEKLGPEQTRDVLDAYTTIVREQVAVFGGSEVKSIRDGYMLAFPSPVDALRSAVAIQRAYADYNSAHPEEPVRALSRRTGRSWGRHARWHLDTSLSGLTWTPIWPCWRRSTESPSRGRS